MALPTTNIRLVYHVACTLGIVTNGKLDTRLSQLVAAAKTGGTNGYAFNIVEAGGAETDGILIDGAEPYWNIFSANSPGRWFIQGANSELNIRLRREDSKYRFALGDFAGYNHDAVRPYLFPEGDRIYITRSQYATIQGITIFWNFGEIDWESIIGVYTHIHVYVGKELNAASPIVDEYISIEDYNLLGHYTIEVLSTAFDGLASGDYLYIWGDFASSGSDSKICTFPTTSYGILEVGSSWAKNVLGNVSVVIQSTPDFIEATNYTVSSATMTDTDSGTTHVQFNITKTAEDEQTVSESRSYIRCKWTDRDSWQDCPSYTITLPSTEFTRTQYCTLPLREGYNEEYTIDIQLVLVYE